MNSTYTANDKKVININDLHNVPTEPNINTYVCAPCGSGKSVIVLEKDIVDILNKKQHYKIIMLTDKITVALKQCASITKITNEHGFNDVILYYNDIQK